MRSHSKILLPAIIILLLFLSLSTTFATELNVNDANTTLSATEKIEVLKEGEGTFTELSELINSSTDEVTLSKDYTASDGEGAIEISNRTITINGNDKTIDANYLTGIFNITDSNVVLNNIRLVNGNVTGGSAILFNNTNLTLNTVTVNEMSTSSAIYTADGVSNLTVNSSTFTDNKHYSISFTGDKINIKDSEFTSSIILSDYSNVYVVNSNLNIENSIFTNCMGRGIRLSGSEAHINKTNFTNNQENFVGIYAASSYLNIANSIFTDNGAVSTRNIYTDRQCYICMGISYFRPIQVHIFCSTVFF